MPVNEEGAINFDGCITMELTIRSIPEPIYKFVTTDTISTPTGFKAFIHTDLAESVPIVREGNDARD